MTRRLLLAAAILVLASPASAAALSDAIKGDMPQLMTLYRDLHANPELSMQEVRTPAKLAAEVRKLGFTVTEKVGKSGVVAEPTICPRTESLASAGIGVLASKALFVSLEDISGSGFANSEVANATRWLLRIGEFASNTDFRSDPLSGEVLERSPPT